MSIVEVLMQKPKKDKGVNQPHTPFFSKDLKHQADLLFMPTDSGYKYALVVADVGTRTVDAEPIKGKRSSDVLNAFKIIYKRKILNKPKQISVDDGSEFKGPVAEWFRDNHVGIKTALPARHRQQSIVENKNKLIAKILFKRMHEQEFETGVESNQWTDDLPKVISKLNENAMKRHKQLKPKTPTYQCQGNACDMYPQGMQVHVILDAPRDYVNKKRLHGNFRETDLRFSKEPHTIEKVIVEPGQPPMYVLEHDSTTAYTKNQLIPVKKTAPISESVIRPHKSDQGDQYVVEKIVGKRRVKNKIEYQVKWSGYTKATWEPRASLIKQIPELIAEYEKKE